MNPMHTAEVRIAADDDFGDRLKEMRLWLDAKRFAPTTFTYFFRPPGTTLRVSFDIENEAVAFALKFDGILVNASDPCRPGSGHGDGVGPALR